ncbi:LytTR family DNA-binding domain-containing protein [Acidaminobacter sp. JC074]|uniref:LytR/AlgR family response regulator transcription factor n=1 Tax=Acidaminobacter sp. JC074 TaxID=2530199 RepID=UPI001F0DEDDE|nr:LytTR family DNA-binding domain-containing protein [Acidaminobacter sp. JC074]
MINILLLEDDKKLLNHYKDVVENTFDDCQVFLATTGKKAITIAKSQKIDLMLLDMELDEEKKVLGLDYANMISIIQQDIDFMIISGFSEYLRDAGDVEPYYYFMKPVNDAFLSRKLQEWEILKSKNVKQTQKNIRLQTESGMAIVPLNRISYIEKMERKIKIKTFNKEYVCKDSLRNMMTKLDDRFFHAHQSFIVNMLHIESIEAQEDRTWKIEFKGIEDEALLSRYKAKAFFNVFEGVSYESIS